MTQDEIIEMARQCGFEKFSHDDCDLICYPEEIEAFANLVAEHERERIKAANAPEIERINAHIKELKDAVLAEREACSKLADAQLMNTSALMSMPPKSSAAWNIASAIRARGQA
jgi:hypothetical protein